MIKKLGLNQARIKIGFFNNPENLYKQINIHITTLIASKKDREMAYTARRVCALSINLCSNLICYFQYWSSRVICFYTR